MTIEEKFEMATENGCYPLLQGLAGLDEQITVKELRSFLLHRSKEQREQANKAKQNFHEKLKGKALKFLFKGDDPFILYVKIDDIKFEDTYGTFDVKLKGEEITISINKAEIRQLSESACWENYFPNDGYDEIKLDEFEQKKKIIQSMVEPVIN